MTNIDLERLKVDREYWDSVAPDGARYYILATGIFVEDTLGRHTDRVIPRPTQKAQVVEWVEYPSGRGKLVIAEPDNNGVVIVLDESGEYRRVAKDNIRTKEQSLREEFIKVVCDIASEHSLHRVDDIATKVFDEYLSRYNLEPKQ